MTKWMWLNHWNCIAKGTNNCGKRRKCWLPAFSPFPTMFSEGFFPRVIKSWDCVVKTWAKFNVEQTALLGMYGTTNSHFHSNFRNLTTGYIPYFVSVMTTRGFQLHPKSDPFRMTLYMMMNIADPYPLKNCTTQSLVLTLTKRIFPKTYWEKELLLVTGIFSFFYYFSNQSKTNSRHIWATFDFFVCYCFWLQNYCF